MAVEYNTVYVPVHAVAVAAASVHSLDGRNTAADSSHMNPNMSSDRLKPNPMTFDSENHLEPASSEASDTGQHLSQFHYSDLAPASNRSTNSISSSSSTDSYHSANFPYTEESDDGHQRYATQRDSNPVQLDLPTPVYAPNMRSDDTVFEQFPGLNSPGLFFNDPDSQQLLESCIQSELGDNTTDSSHDLLDTESSTADPQSDESIHRPVCQLYSTSCSLAQNSQQSSSNSPIRPQSLSFRARPESPKSFDLLSQSNDMPLSFTNTASNPFFGLEEQLASADIAWMGALDLPNICLDEVDKILSPSSCLTSPTKDTPSFQHIVDEKYSQTVMTNEIDVESGDFSSLSSIRVESTNSMLENQIQKRGVATGEVEYGKRARTTTAVYRSMQMDSDSRKSELADSDSTLTCSEAEYYSNWIQENGRRTRRKRGLRRVKRDRWNIPTESDSDSGADEPQNWHTSVFRYRTPQGTRRLSTPSQGLSHRCRSKSSDADLKPWWPKTNTPFSGRCGISVDIPPSMDELSSSNGSSPTRLDDEQPMSSMSDTAGTPRSNDSGCPCSPNSSLNIGSSKSIVSSTSTATAINSTDKIRSNAYQSTVKSKNIAHTLCGRCSDDTAGNQTIWRSRRRRKQLELWQFILCKLETCKQSAFQWVNRSAGVFCITDTMAGAREWGRYRNNNRMDYEKMARAMRFYYKDHILRKSRQQLHFQFAMSYVEWASRFYHSG